MPHNYLHDLPFTCKGAIVYRLAAPAALPACGPKLLWHSEPVPSGDAGDLVVTPIGRQVYLLDVQGDAMKVLGKGPIDIARCTSAALADGRLHVRGAKSVRCYAVSD